MPRSCTVCTHPEREAIDQALTAQSASNRRIASQYGMSERAIRSHKERHLPERLCKAVEAAEVAEAGDLLSQVQALNARALRILDTAEQAGSLNVALGAIRESRGTIELLGKLTHQISTAPTLNVLLAPEWLAVRASLLDALTPYPEARVAVAGRLAALEAGHDRE